MRTTICLQFDTHSKLSALRDTYNYKSYDCLLKDLLKNAKKSLFIQVPQVPQVSIEQEKKVKTKLDIRAAKRDYYQKRLEDYWSTK